MKLLDDNKNLILAKKKVGETPLQCIERYRNELNIDADVPMTYAGRLDPLASGLLPILVGQAVYEKEHYSGLDKHYTVQVLVGIATDTYDILGIPHCPQFQSSDESHIDHIEEVAQNFVTTFSQVYPPYSSKTVMGKPLWQWAREGRLGEIEIPTHEVSIYDITFMAPQQILALEVLDHTISILGKIDGDFRQKEIQQTWRVLIDKSPRSFNLVNFSVHCGSGMYVRQLVHDIGVTCGVPLCLYNLKRTGVGDYTLPLTS